MRLSSRGLPEGAEKRKLFYGWIIVAACFGVTLTLGETFWSFGVFFKPLENEFGWNRAVVSSGYTAFLIGYAVSGITSGRLADRYRPRPILLVSAVLAGLGIALCSRVQDVTQLRLFLGMAGLGAGPTWSVPGSVVQRWFHRKPKAGLALAIVTSGVGAGAVIFAPLINYLILTYGWRSAYLVVGILFFVIIAVSSLVMKPSPTDAGTASPAERGVAEPRRTRTPARGKVMTSPAFLYILFIFCVGTFGFQAVTVHLMPGAADVGISPTVAAAAVGLMGGSSIAGRMVSGLISDRLGWQKVLALSYFGMALSMVSLLLLRAVWMLYCFVISYGMFQGIRAPAQVGILSDFFGVRSLGELIGVSYAVSTLLGALAPSLVGFLFDTTGSYTVPFGMVTAFLCAGAIVMTTVRAPSNASLPGEDRY